MKEPIWLQTDRWYCTLYDHKAA